jgi:hypothetical protein
MDNQEYNELKSEFLDQSKEFSEALERINQGDLTVNTKLSVLKHELRSAIASAYNTSEIIKIFGYKLEDELEKQLNSLNEDFKLKKIGIEEMHVRKVDILNKLKAQNENKLTKEDLDFLESNLLSQLDSID